MLRADAALWAATVTVTEPSPDPLAGDAVAQAAPEDAVHAQPGCAVTVTLALPPPAATDTVAGDTVYTHGAAAWFTVTVWPATVNVALRDEVTLLGPTVTVTEPSPDPLAGNTVAHVALDDAAHVQPACAVTVIAALPPPAATDTVAGDTVYTHGAAAWFTVTVWPATVNVALRDEVALLALTVTVTDPFPDPLAGDTVAHAALDEVAHAQPACAVTVTVALPPPAATDTVVGAAV